MLQPLYDSGLHPEQMKLALGEFIGKVAALSRTLGMDTAPLQLDHIAMRINETELAGLAHQAWLKEGSELSCAEINGRPIIVIEFDRPLQFSHWTVECLELPYPAPGKSYPEQSWEHVEFVLPSQAETPEQFLQDVFARFPELHRRWEQLPQQGIKVKLSSPKGEGERLFNPTVAFKAEGVCIKLHPHSLKTIIASEQASSGS